MRHTHAALVRDAVNAVRLGPAALVPRRPQSLSAGTPLRSVFDAYLEAQRNTLRPSTYQPRKSHLTVLHDLLQEALNAAAREARRGARPLTLDDFTTENIQPIVDGLRGQQLYNARGKAVAARAVGAWLAETGKWYVGDERIPGSVLYRLRIPQDKKTGRQVYEEHELQTIRQAATSHPSRPYFHLAAQRMDELGIRAGFEAMTVRLRDVHLAQRRGEVSFIRIQEDNTKTDAGAREVPLEPDHAMAFRSYVELERPAYAGSAETAQPFFLTVRGGPFTYGGWNSFRRRFKRLVQQLDPTIDYKASRNRGTRTKKLRPKLEDSEIMQVMGWDSPTMIGRYAGKIPTEEIAAKIAS